MQTAERMNITQNIRLLTKWESEYWVIWRIPNRHISFLVCLGHLSHRYIGTAGLENGLEKLGLKKPNKTQKVQNLGFLVKFYTDDIKFHILIMICEFCYILQKMLWQRELCIGCSSWVEILSPVLFVHWNLKKT